MIPSTTLKHNPDSLGRFLDYNDEVEHPVVLQVQRHYYYCSCCRALFPYENAVHISIVRSWRLHSRSSSTVVYTSKSYKLCRTKLTSFDFQLLAVVLNGCL